MKNIDIQSWADTRETSLEVAQAIFELANNDEQLAQQIWDNGDDRVLALAFSKTDKDELYWGTEKASRGCGA